MCSDPEKKIFQREVSCRKKKKKRVEASFLCLWVHPSVMSSGWAQGFCENEQEQAVLESANLMSDGVHLVEVFR